jgi:DNA-binding NtrC family response regulator
MAKLILVVEDDDRVRASVARVLSAGGAEVHVAETGEAALARLDGRLPDLLISDVRMPGMGGMELLRLVRERAPQTDVVLMTAYDDLPTVARAMKLGATDFLVKPLDLHQLRNVVERVFADRRARADPGRDDVDRGAAGERLVGHDDRMVEIYKLVGQLAAGRTNALIRGESGTGKELIARAIHQSSDSAGQPFIAVNCAAIPETLLQSELFGHVRGSFTGAAGERKGRFSLAGRGTLFLDEIGDTSPDFQTKLLRVLQEREFYPVGADHPVRTEARVIAATHRDLETMVREGAFREDLYYRLRVVEIRVPPLRERLSDLPAIADHLIGRAAEAAGREPPMIAPESMEALMAHHWPGNVRELENCLVRALVVATGRVIRPHHLAIDATGTEATPRLSTLDAVEAAHVARVLRATGGNRTRAAEILGVSRPRLRRLIEKFGVAAQPES